MDIFHNNETAGLLTNMSTLLVPPRGEKGHVSNWLVAFAWTAASWTILSNAVLVTAILNTIRANGIVFTRLVLSLSICDLVVGIACVPILVSESFASITNYIGCSFCMFLFFVSQLASIYHVLGICIYRASTIRTVLIQRLSNEKWTAALIAICSWLVACCVLVVCFFKWASSSPTSLDYCTVDSIFPDDSRAMMFLGLNYVAPQIVTDIVYLYACIRLRQIVRSVVPEAWTDRNYDSNTTRNPTGELQLSRAEHVTSVVFARTQRRVLGTIGLITLVFNLLTIPLVVCFLMSGSFGYMGRDFRYIVSCLFTLNSAITPSCMHTERLGYVRQFEVCSRNFQKSVVYAAHLLKLILLVKESRADISVAKTMCELDDISI